MLSRSARLAVLALLIGGGALAAEEARKCNASAHECEVAIRKMMSGRRYLGAQLQEIELGGLVVKAVTPEGPAERADLRIGDRLMMVNGHPTSDATIRDFKQLLSDARETGQLKLIVQRHGTLKRVEVRLEPFSKAQIDKIVAQHLAEAHPASANAPQPQQ